MSIQRLLSPLRRRIQLMLSRAMGRLVDPKTLLQTLQVEVLKGELLAGVEHMEGYGRTAHPPEGFEALVASLGGDRAHSVCLACVHRQYRPRDLKPGEQAIYDDLGNQILILRDRILIKGKDLVEVQAPNVKVVSTTEHEGNVSIAGNLNVDGNFGATGSVSDGTGSMQDMRDTYNGHKHTGNQGSPTSTPLSQM